MDHSKIRFRLGRALIALGARLISIKWSYRLRRYRRDQLTLAKRYGVDAATPEPFGASTEERIDAAAHRFPRGVAYALTSGSTGGAKRFLYPRARTRRLSLLFAGQVMLAFAHLRLARPISYLLVDARSGPSLSALLTGDPHRGLMERWLFPQSFLRPQEILPLTERHTQDVVHLTLLTLINPTMIITVNPSSLYVLLDRAGGDWKSVRDEIRAVLREELVSKILRRSGAAGERRREDLVAMIAAPAPPPPAAFLPALQAVYCWDGGAVEPFIHNLRVQLSGVNPTFYPMLSVSTETIATLVLPHLSAEGGFPLWPEVCYEFLPTEETGAPHSILKPWELTTGQEYEMVVSDPYGLLRYRTEDIFACLAQTGEAPLLRFVRRSGLSYSFTGEKLTGEQLERVYTGVRGELGAPHLVFTCFPRRNAGGLPGYVIVCSAAGTTPGAPPRPEVVDQALMEINPEYARKRLTGRLASAEVWVESYATLVDRIRRSAPRVSAEQFKLLPLYTMLWETLDLPQPTLSSVTVS